MNIQVHRLTPAEVTDSLLAVLGHPDRWAADPQGCLERARTHAGRDDRLILIAYADAHPVGLAEAQDYGTSLWREFRVIRLHDLFVNPHRRRLGIGRQLVQDVLTWAAQRPDPGFIEWQANRRAVPFYEALGFTADYVSDVPDFPYFVVDLRHSNGPRTSPTAVP